MNAFLDAVTEALRGLDGARRALGSAGVSGPFAAALAVQMLALLALALAFHPALAPAMVPVIERLGGTDALHYPMHLVLLPAIHQVVYLALFVLVAFPLYMVALRHAVRRTGVEVVDASVLRTIPDGIALGLAYAVAAVVPSLVAERFALAAGNPIVRAVLHVAGMAAVAWALVHVVYAPVARLRWKGSLFDSLRRAARMAAHRRGATWTLVVLAIVVQLPLSLLLGVPDRVALRLRPETIVVLEAASTVLDVVVAAFVLGAAVALSCEKRGLSW